MQQKRCERLSPHSRLPGPGGPVTFYVIETFKPTSKIEVTDGGKVSDGGLEWGPNKQATLRTDAEPNRGD